VSAALAPLPDDHLAASGCTHHAAAATAAAAASGSATAGVETEQQLLQRVHVSTEQVAAWKARAMR
jgi:hypothetical protein